jgi:amidase
MLLEILKAASIVNGGQINLPGVGRARELGRLDAHDQAALVRRGECTALELAEAAMERIERLDRALGAVSVRAFEIARAQAVQARPTNGLASGLAGVPYLLKDSLDYPGMRSACGSRALAARGPAAKGYPYVERLDALGLIPLGKTNAPEFSLLPTTESVLFGSARNPWAPDHSSGGSSGGAAVAVASGMVPIAHGGDGGGSIRIPASCCGLVGLKATRGSQLRARAPHIIEDLLVSDGFVARSVRDVEWAFEALRPQAPLFVAPITRAISHVKPLRVGVVELNLFGEAPHPHVSEILLRAADLCASLGHHVSTATPPVQGPAVIEAFRTIWVYLGHEIVSHLSSSMSEAALSEQLEVWTLGLARQANHLVPLDTQEVFERAAEAARALELWFSTYDVMLTPVLNEPPPPLGRYSPQQPFESLFESMFRYVSYTPLQNLSGHPAISLPLFRSPQGLPVGSMFTAPRGREDRLFALASQLEQAQPWAHLLPDIWPDVRPDSRS